jgi:hypothetical protein
LFEEENILKKIDLRKRMREVKFITEHTLTPDQRDKMIKDKLERYEREYLSRKVQQERTLQP